MVYIDQVNLTFGRMTMNHLVADTTDELLHMVDLIGVPRKWIQYPGTSKEHFDICLSKKAMAIANGAVEVGNVEMGRIIRNKIDLANTEHHLWWSKTTS